jgi:minor extracellular serine protease Vpr
MTPLRFRLGIAAALAAAASAILLSGASAETGRRAVTLSALPSVAANALDSKLGAPLRLVVERAEASQRATLSGARRDPLEFVFDSRSPLSVLRDPRRAEPEAMVFMRLDRPESARELEARGVEILTVVEDIATARIPLSRVREVAALESVRYLELSGRSPALLDSSRRRTGVLTVHQGGGGLPQAFNGAGVIVGVLDGGLDYKHPDFRTSASDSRLLALFDYGTGANGVECRPGQLDSLTCPEKDGSGGFSHGTHVTGTAAGNGRRNPAYIGMAPNADLIFVKGIRDEESNGGFTDADVLAGSQFVFNKARQFGRPCVLNLSLGGQIGPHDGTTLYEQALGSLTGPGRIIVVAAGNSGGQNIHASYAAQGDDYDTALETLWAISNGATASAVDLWYPGGTSISVGLAAYNPGNYSAPVYVSGPIAPGQAGQGTATNGGIELADLSIDARTTSDPNNGARRVFIQIADAGGSVRLSDLVWSVYTFGSGTVDMWVVANGEFAPDIGGPAYLRPGDDAKTIGSPATGRKLIAVGSHVTKTQWIDMNGVTRTQTGATLDAISGFSSRGPSRDNRVLPHLTAPGEAILAALSSDYPAVQATVLLGGGLFRQQGTSMASPHVTGVVALMLQRDPALTPENARDLLQQTATPAGGGVPNNVFGAGKMNALAALLSTPDAVPCVIANQPAASIEDCEEFTRRIGAQLQAWPNPVADQVTLAFRLDTAEHLNLAIYDLLGRRVRTLRDEASRAGPVVATWDRRNDRGLRVPAGVYFARALTSTHSALRRMVVVH